MQLRKLALQDRQSSLPTQLDFLRILSLRGSAHFQKEKEQYKSLIAGHMGEEKMLAYLEEYGDSDWIILRNVWLKDFVRFECDFILMTMTCIYIFEVKNYKGTFTYDNGKCYYDAFETSLNPLEQLRSNVVNLKNIVSKAAPHLEVKGAVIFAGEDHEVQINTPVDDIQIVTSNGIRNFLLKISEKEAGIYNRHFDAEQLLRVLNQFEIENPFLPEPLTLGEMNEVSTGICCANCHSFDVEITKFKVRCACGLTESREEAVVRTICDYGVLTYKSDMMVSDLLPFFKQLVSRTFLKETLNKHFTHIKKSSYSNYVNLKRPYSKVRHLFKFARPFVFRNKHQDIYIHKS